MLNMLSIKCGFSLILLLALPCIESGYVKEFGGKRLNQYISHYETLSYDVTDVHASHSRAKRSVTKDSHVNLKFNAYGKKFHVRLKRDITTFSDRLVIDSRNGLINVDTSHIYQGNVIGDHNSHVFGSIINGIFEGKIITETDSYYIEHAKHYFPNGTHLDHGFHSIIYNENHVDDPHNNQPQPHHHQQQYDDQNEYSEGMHDTEKGGCGISQDILRWMDTIQNAGVEDSENYESDLFKINNNFYSNNNTTSGGNISNNSGGGGNHRNTKLNSIVNNNYDGSAKYPHMKYTKEANSKSWHNGEDAKHHERVRRASSSSSSSSSSSQSSNARSKDGNENRNTCALYIQTDPLIWRHIREGIADHDRGKKSEIDEKTREEILSLIAHHVTAVNYIYRNTKFDGRVEHRNIKFEVQRIKIDDDSACTDSYNGDSNPFCMENIDVSNFLNLHSLGNHELFCLAYVFTYRDFTGGTLGLAWVASASGASGGICEKYKTYTETVGGLYQSTKRSLNTGIITFVNYNSRVPPKVSQLTLAHEIGHNFGSPHDYPQECRPGGIAGNYIMFASATSGDRPNNSKFSTCSIRNISNVLDAIVDKKKRNCFTISEGAFCGNKIVEVGEECDCGFNDDECRDKCCYPRIINEQEHAENSSAEGCRRRARTQCSPSQGPCCLSETCSFVPYNYRQKCKEETECSWSSTCNGTSAECPDPKPRDDKTKCNNGTQLCINGECAGSICLLWNMTECFLTSQIIPKIDKRKLCELACQNGNDTNTCRSTSEFGLQVGLPEEGISLRPGAPCDNFQGYCDVFLKCRAVDAEGPLVRLKNLLFNKQTLLTVAQWVTDNWYVVVLLGIGFIIFMGMFIKCCAVHTPSSNPKKPAARRISETLRHPMHTLRRMRHSSSHPNGPRSVPPPYNERSRGGGGVNSNVNDLGVAIAPNNIPPAGGGGRSGRRDPGSNVSGGGPRSGGGHSRGPPRHGYNIGNCGDGRGDGQYYYYYPPKATIDQVNYNIHHNNNINNNCNGNTNRMMNPIDLYQIRRVPYNSTTTTTSSTTTTSNDNNNNNCNEFSSSIHSRTHHLQPLLLAAASATAPSITVGNQSISSTSISKINHNKP